MEQGRSGARGARRGEVIVLGLGGGVVVAWARGRVCLSLSLSLFLCVAKESRVDGRRRR